MNIPSFDPERNYLVSIVDKLESIEHIEEYIRDMQEVEFSQNQAIQDAVIHRVQIIGEAGGKIPNEIRIQFSQIPWSKIVAMRNLIIHDYAKVDEGEVWRVVKNELPKLKSQLEEVKKYFEQPI